MGHPQEWSVRVKPAGSIKRNEPVFNVCVPVPSALRTCPFSTYHAPIAAEKFCSPIALCGRGQQSNSRSASCMSWRPEGGGNVIATLPSKFLHCLLRQGRVSKPCSIFHSIPYAVVCARQIWTSLTRTDVVSKVLTRHGAICVR